MIGSAGLNPDDPFYSVKIAKRKMTSVLLQATKANPPHLVDVKILNDQKVGIWYTIEPYSQTVDNTLQGWDINRKRFVQFVWQDIVDLKSNSLNYTEATQEEWELRIRDTNLRYSEKAKTRQSKVNAYGKRRN